MTKPSAVINGQPDRNPLIEPKSVLPVTGQPFFSASAVFSASGSPSASNPRTNWKYSLIFFITRSMRLDNLGGIGPPPDACFQGNWTRNNLDPIPFQSIGQIFSSRALLQLVFWRSLEMTLGGSAENWYTFQISLYMFFNRTMNGSVK